MPNAKGCETNKNTCGYFGEAKAKYWSELLLQQLQKAEAFHVVLTQPHDAT
jgi:hypothetical protein